MKRLKYLLYVCVLTGLFSCQNKNGEEWIVPENTEETVVPEEEPPSDTPNEEKPTVPEDTEEEPAPDIPEEEEPTVPEETGEEPLPDIPDEPVKRLEGEIAYGSLHDGGDENIPRQDLIITSAEEWENLLNDMDKAHAYPPLTETEIDFGRYQILAVFDKMHLSGGWTIDITSITEESDRITVTVENLRKGNALNNLTQPFHIVKIPVSEKEIIFRHVE
jgi:hypothetical protein